MVSNPEFLREGQAVHDCLHPDRVVIGSDDKAAALRVAALYESLDAPLIVTDPPTAETIKYACNAFLATKVSFINAIANLCQAVGADVRDVVLGMGYDKRIGFEFLKPGPGWGGSCFPKDSRALVRIAEDHGYNFDLLKGVIAVNDEQFEQVVKRIERLAGRPLEGATIAVWGLTFKAGTDDLRDSPAVAVVRRLVERGARVQAYDPTVSEALPAHAAHPSIEVYTGPYAACAGAEVLAVLTEWDEFRWVDFAKVAELLAASSDHGRPQPPRPGRSAPQGVSVREHGSQLSRVVVAGGAGFLGTHLCLALLARGDEVVSIDNLVTGSRSQSLRRSRTERGFTFLRQDIVDAVDVPGPVDVVMNLASPASPKDFAAIPVEILQVGSAGTKRLLDLALAKGARYFHASTSEVYGDPLVHPQPETYWGNVNPIGPRSVYDEAKRYGEALTMAYHRSLGLEVRIVRIFNTYGPLHARRRRPGRVELHLSGPRAATADGVRGRDPDPELHLRDRRGRWLPGPARIGLTSVRSTSATPTEFTVLELARLVLGGHRIVVGSDLRARSPSTIRPNDGRTSPWPARCSGGSRKWRWPKGSKTLWPGFPTLRTTS